MDDSLSMENRHFSHPSRVLSFLCVQCFSYLFVNVCVEWVMSHPGGSWPRCHTIASLAWNKHAGPAVSSSPPVAVRLAFDFLVLLGLSREKIQTTAGCVPADDDGLFQQRLFSISIFKSRFNRIRRVVHRGSAWAPAESSIKRALVESKWLHVCPSPSVSYPRLLGTPEQNGIHYL